MDDDALLLDASQPFETAEEALRHLRAAGVQDDADVDLAEAALALALAFLPGLHVDRYRQHIEKLKSHVREEHLSRLRLSEEDSANLRARTLVKILHGAHGYQGDAGNPGDVQNANFIRMIDQRKGLSAALGLLYVILARAQGWDACALAFPKRFLVRLEHEGARLIIDPFEEGREMDAALLRRLLKTVLGKDAELAHDYYAPLSNRDMLLRLPNDIKTRLIEGEDFPQAILVVEAMEALAPDDCRLLFDKGVLYMRVGHARAAAQALELYIKKTPDRREKELARRLLQQIR